MHRVHSIYNNEYYFLAPLLLYIPPEVPLWARDKEKRFPATLPLFFFFCPAILNKSTLCGVHVY